MNYKDIGYYCHILIPIAFIMMPFLSPYYLRYLVFAPSLIYILWIICGGCPLTHATQDNNEQFIESLLKKIHPKLAKNTDLIIGFILTFILAIIAYSSLSKQIN